MQKAKSKILSQKLLICSFLLIGSILVFLGQFIFSNFKVERTTETSTLAMPSPTPETLENVVTFITHADTQGMYKNNTLQFSFNFDDDLFIEEHQEIINPKLENSLNKSPYFAAIKLRTHLIIKDKNSEKQIAVIRIQNTPYIKNYKNFSEAAIDTFKYWRSSTSQFSDTEKNRYSELMEFNVFDHGNSLVAYRYIIYRPDKNFVWIYIPQKYTTSDEQLAKNAVDFISIQYEQDDEQRMSKILKSFSIN